MEHTVLMKEKEFSMAFMTCKGQGDKWRCMATNEIQDNGYILQERIIVSTDNALQANKNAMFAEYPSRCCPPLLTMVPGNYPVQHSGIVIHPENGAQVTPINGAMKTTASGIEMLFSHPFFAAPDANEASFSNVFDRIHATLVNADMNISALTRTWLFAKDLLQDYTLLNVVRRKYFDRHLPNRNCFLPASTGIQGRLLNNASLGLQFFAFSGHNLEKKQIASPLQNEPIQYGKLFSRAACISFPVHKLLFISGTASIDEKGLSVHHKDFKAQMRQMLKVIKAILYSQNGDFSNIAQGTIYLKKQQNAEICLEIEEQLGFPHWLTLIQPGTDVCRDELLCEIEVHAVIKREHR